MKTEIPAILLDIATTIRVGQGFHLEHLYSWMRKSNWCAPYVLSSGTEASSTAELPLFSTGQVLITLRVVTEP